MKKQVHIIISGDYELFGNGSGDVGECMIKPTNDLLSICEKYDAKYTIFAEVCEYWAFKKYAKALEHDLGCMPHELIEKQLQDAIVRGHDVQLHFHPQWLDATYNDGEWQLNYDWWRLPNVSHGLGSKDDTKSLTGLFYQGKKTLEDLLKPINPDYKCIGFRAGGYCIQPEKMVIKAMKQNGILVDSTVFKNGFNNNNPYYYDFRNAYSSIGPWKTTTMSVNKKSSEERFGLVEFPILSTQLSFVRKLFEMLMKKVNKNRFNKYNCTGETLAQSLQKKENPIKSIERVFHFFQDRTIQWDYGSYSENTMKSIFLKSLNKDNVRSKDYAMLMMTGHPKDLISPVDFNQFLKWLSLFRNTNSSLQFTTLSESYHQFLRNEKEAKT